MNKIKIALVDDHTIVREGFKMLLNSSDRFEVVAEAGDGDEAIGMLENNEVDVLLLDIYMPKMNGIDLCEQLKSKGMKTPVLFLSMHNNNEYFMKAIKVGASGFLLKDCERDELFLAVNKIASGDTYFANNVSNTLLRNFIGGKKSAKNKIDKVLTSREKDILLLAMEGHSAKVIGERLFISSRTVDKHRSNIMNKFNVHSTIELINYVRNNNLV